MLKRLKKNALLKILYKLKKKYNKKRIPFAIDIYDVEGNVNMQIFNSLYLNSFGLKNTDDFGFVIFLYFNEKNADNNHKHIEFQENQYFEQFTKVIAKGYVNYLFSCGSDIYRVEKIASDILKDVYNALEEEKQIKYYGY